ncbi:uncharacterized protein LOC133880493 isoform X4 [Alnus glutinosa]|uniref:uncharacterized protein LOC133880493 isoform X4 n=1 Tax=Alnus glutinosa TaxID=3517 RepID=UPI002D77EEDF|nr:uncharacterized protein LOC133880493 isoform X4 [Alnus glutinosa]
MEIKDASSAPHRQVPDKDTYLEWSDSVKTLLMNQDLWEIVEATTEPPKKEDDETTFKAWSMKNSMALTIIKVSCGPDALSEIREIDSANIAWNTLAEKYNVSKNTSSGNTMLGSYASHQQQNNLEIASRIHGSEQSGNVDHLQYEALNKAVQRGDWNATEEFLNGQPGAWSAKITFLGETALHVAVKAGRDHEHIVEKLVDVMSEEDLAIQDSFGGTALAYTINSGNYRMAACMLKKNKKLVSIRTQNGEIPVIHAIDYGHIELARYLYSLTPLEDLMPENGSNGATLCGQAIYTRTLDIALDLIQRCPRLSLSLDREGYSPLYALASMAYAFPSGNPLVFWKRWIYSCIHIQPARATKEIRLNFQNVEKSQSDQIKIIELVPALLRQLLSNLLNFLGIEDLYEMKLVHVQSHELLDRMCKEVLISNIEKRGKGRVYDAIFRSIQKGIFEFIFGKVRANPDLVWSQDKDSRTIFSLSVLHRQAKIFSLIYRLDLKKALTYRRDNYRNHILHMAGMTGASTLINRIPGPALQMQRELQWFKEVESIVHPKVKESLNNDGLTPRELFTKNHKDLMKEGEQWMKDTATSCTVVGALIVTIMFAAAFTVPGGNNQDTGLPLFLSKKVFMLFIISDSLSLFSSSTSVLMFLGILTSRYAEDDFLKSLPTKMIIGLSTLFFSIATMMIAFSAALFVMLREHSWIVIPVICLASVPVTLFIVMQFPLLVDMSISTYGPGVFNRKMKRWF